MSGAAELAIRRDVGWSEALVTEFFQATPLPSAAACNAALIEVVGLADRLIAGPELMSADRRSWILPMAPAVAGSPAQPEVGRYLSRAVLTGSSERELAALALGAIASDIHAATVERPAEGVRPAGVTWLAIGAGVAVVALVGLAVAWYADRSSRATADARVSMGATVEATRLTADRYRRAAETGQPVAPPSEIELAAAANIQALAQRARELGIGQQVAAATGGIAKMIGAMAALWVVVQLFGSKRG